MKFLKSKLFFWFLTLLPIFWIFRNVFIGQLPTWGDAPFFYPEGLEDLFWEPLVWVQRGTSFGGASSLLWLSPIMFLFGVLNKFFSLESDTLVRIFFYAPSIILAATGPYFLTRYLGFSKAVSFFASLFYVLNTYFILLVDGGQAGVALAYGLFPFIILFGKKVLKKTTVNSFFLFLLLSFVLTVVDPRIYVVAFFTLLLWQILDSLFIRDESWKKLWILLLAVVILILLNFYWINPILKIKISGLSLNVASLQLSSLLNSLLLYAPHWPSNVFGKVTQPPFYFALWPILILGSLLFVQKNRKILSLVVCFLLIAFIAKGSTPPLGNIYNFFINRFSLGFAFRDSSKFFIPLMLLGGILIGEAVNNLYTIFKSKVLLIFVYLFLLFSVHPTIWGEMNFILSNRKVGTDYQIIYNKLKVENGFFRTVWFPEKHPLAFETLDKPVLDARELVTNRPFAAINASEDVFNFLNNPEYVDWMKVLGVKYLFLSGDPRNISPGQKEIKDWNTIVGLIDRVPGLFKREWGTTFPVYEVPGILPKARVVDRLIAIVGPELDSGIKSTVPSVYFEDGEFAPKILNGKNQDSVKLLFNGKEKLDLTMSFLQKYFKSTEESVKSGWAIYGADQYLKTKYELLIRGFDYKDFDYKRGLAFSTKAGESIKFKFAVPEDGNYILAKRLGTKEKQNMFWITEEKSIKKGKFEYEVVNNSGFEVLNVIALIPKEEFIKAQEQSDVFVKHFGVVTDSEVKDSGWREIGLEKEGTLKYKFTPPQEGYWIIFSDSYNPEWKFKRGVEYFDSVPVYSMINGFYVEPKWGDLHIEFRGQEYFRWGLWIGAISALSLSIIFLILVEKDNERKNSKDLGN